jgi:phytoene dehydrogenase-like protein
MTAYDTIILGSSPNALTLAAYLAKAKQKVLVLEHSSNIGGAIATTSFAEGFQADLSLMSGQLDEVVVKELELDKHSLEVIERNTISSLLPNGQSFTLSKDRQAAREAIEKFAPNDAARYNDFMQLLDLASSLLRSAYNNIPPQAHNPSTSDQEQLDSLVGQLRGYGRREMTEVMRLLVMPVRDLLNEWFENTELKGLLGNLAIRSLTQGPFATGTTFSLLHHLAINDGYFRTTSKGGVGAIAKALATAAQSYGTEIRSSVEVKQVVIKDGAATGVELASGEVLEAGLVVSDYDAQYSFTKLIAPPELEPEFNRELQHVRYNGAVARINLALSALPDISTTGLSQEALQGTLVLAPSVTAIEKAFDCAKYGNVSAKPCLEVTIPSLTDPTLAPAGQHVMSIWVQYVAYKAKADGQSICKLALSQLSEFMPNLESLVLHKQVLTPQDFETQFHLTEGHLYGGDMTLAQAFFLRPIPGFAQYQTPIERFYLCGAATHPGGGISGLAGRNAAKQILGAEF